MPKELTQGPLAPPHQQFVVFRRCGQEWNHNLFPPTCERQKKGHDAVSGGLCGGGDFEGINKNKTYSRPPCPVAAAICHFSALRPGVEPQLVPPTCERQKKGHGAVRGGLRGGGDLKVFKKIKLTQGPLAPSQQQFCHFFAQLPRGVEKFFHRPAPPPVDRKRKGAVL